MTKELVLTAKSVEEAVAEAARRLNIPEADLKFEVLEQPKKGFLGIGSSDARISVSYEPSVKEATEEFLHTLLADMNLEAGITCEEKENGEIAFQLTGDGLGVLIGHHGDVLESLQYILSLVTNRHGDDYVRVTVDIENYRAKREEALCALARRTAARVKKTGRNVTFEPMSAYERRIIHSQAQEIEGVTTHSVGSGDQRRVVMSSTDPRRNVRRAPKPEEPKSEKPKVVYEYNPVREPKKIVKAKSIEDINLADVEDTEEVHL